MRLVVVSDTHGFHVGMDLPDGDVLIHCGDWTRGYGSEKDTLKFASWLGRQGHKYKLVVPGNHDHEDLKTTEDLLGWTGAKTLGASNSEVEIDGIRFAGGPWMPISGHSPAYSFERDDEWRYAKWAALPPCDVLITHCPPFGILDYARKLYKHLAHKGSRARHLGCEALLQRVREVNPRYHFFGHVHESRGVETIGPTTFVNAANCTRQSFERKDSEGVTHMTMSVRDAMVFDIETGE